MAKLAETAICPGMCVVALAWQVHPDWPLILIGNRDEFHDRPAAPLHIWEDDSGLVAGRDVKAGGTWLGLQRHDQRLVVVTNIRGALPDPAKESRGALVADILRGAGRFADPDIGDLDHFNPFNLLRIERDEAWLLSNRPQPRKAMLAPGIHAIANEPVDQPCPRADRLRDALMVTVAAGTAPEELLDTLAATGDPALFLLGETYGTRASTLVTLDAHGEARMIERRFEAGGRSAGTTALAFSLS